METHRCFFYVCVSCITVLSYLEKVLTVSPCLCYGTLILRFQNNFDRVGFCGVPLKVSMQALLYFVLNEM